MKFLEQEYPKGTFKGQKTDGAYINVILAPNLDVLAKKIVKDMHFLGIITGHDAVGNGKSTLATQVGAYLTAKINELHGINNTFTNKNVAFKGRDLAKTSLALPKYSVVMLDEGDDLTMPTMSELQRQIRTFFRKCRQLNQILLLIIPSFFELPKFYALSRSHFLIDVKFGDEFARGHFDFYSARKKKLLYIKGKKEWNYDVISADFNGGFTKGYTFFPNIKDETSEYLRRKYEDTIEDHQPNVIDREWKRRTLLLYGMLKKIGKLTHKQLGSYLNVSEEVCEHMQGDYIKIITAIPFDPFSALNTSINNSITTRNDDVVGVDITTPTKKKDEVMDITTLKEKEGGDIYPLDNSEPLNEK